MNPLRKRFEELFSLDVRSLALFRVSLGAGLLFDLAVRALSLKDFYTDAGLMPRARLLALHAENSSFWSLHLLGGTVFTQSLLFVCAAGCALGLLVGYRTRWMTLGSWLLLTSLHNRMPFLQNSGDVYLRLSLFWCLFIPLGIWGSMDSQRNAGSNPLPTKVFTPGTLALFLQFLIVYLTTAAYKFQGEDWSKTGDAVFYVLNLDIFSTPAADALLRFPFFLKTLTGFVLYFELWGPLLMCCPYKTGPVRTCILVVFFLMHLGFAACLKVAPFPRWAVLELLPFIPSWFWNKFSAPVLSLPASSSRFHFKKAEFVLVLFLMTLCLYSVLENYHRSRRVLPSIPPPLIALRDVLGLDQYWNIFAPNISRTSGWIVAPGLLRDGRAVDLYMGGTPLTWDPPARISDHFQNERWRQFMIRVFGGQRERLSEYSQYLCRSWNESHSGQDELLSLSIVQMSTTVLPSHEKIGPRTWVLWKQSCFDQL